MSQRSKLRVGFVVPPLPSPRQKGLELAIDGLAKGLHSRGHEVTVFTVRDPMRTKQWATQVGHVAQAIYTAIAADGELGDCDIVHDHTLAALFVRNLHHRHPLVTTTYSPFDADPIPMYRRRPDDHVPLLAVSLHQNRSKPDSLTVSDVIHPGIDVERYPYRSRSADYLVTLGPMTPDGGVLEAIDVAKATGRPLWIYASVEGPAEHDYFHRVVRPRLDHDIQFEDDLAAPDRRDLLGRAAALLLTGTRDDAFSMAIVEALACGTPIVALDGVASEIIEPGEHGYIGRNNGDLIRGVHQIDKISRAACRRRAERYFDCNEVARYHEEFYREVLADACLEQQQPLPCDQHPTRTSEPEPSAVLSPVVDFS